MWLWCILNMFGDIRQGWLYYRNVTQPYKYNSNGFFTAGCGVLSHFARHKTK